MASVHFLLLIGALTALSDAAQVQQGDLTPPSAHIDDLYQAVDVPKMIHDGREESLYKIQKTLQYGVNAFELPPTNLNQPALWGRSKYLSYLLAGQLVYGDLPLDRYGEDVLNIIAYLKESGPGLQQPHIFTNDGYDLDPYPYPLLPKQKQIEESPETYSYKPRKDALPILKPREGRHYYS